jgi:CDP-diacylglycerol pyrophosphatase
MMAAMHRVRAQLVSRRRRTLLAGVALMAGAYAAVTHAADRDALLHIVQDQCLPHWQVSHDAAPCAAVAADSAVLHDRKGGAHFLLIATRTVRGIEDPLILQADSPNYFAAAWRARGELAALAGHPIRDVDIGLAINSAVARGQDQLHIHIECLRPDVRRMLRAAAARISDRWAPVPGWRYAFLARRVSGDSLEHVNPFRLLAEAQPGIRRNMGGYTLVLAGAQFDDGPGFVLLAGRTAVGVAALLPPPAGRVPPGETLLDSSCDADP